MRYLFQRETQQTVQQHMQESINRADGEDYNSLSPVQLTGKTIQRTRQADSKNTSYHHRENCTSRLFRTRYTPQLAAYSPVTDPPERLTYCPGTR